MGGSTGSNVFYVTLLSCGHSREYPNKPKEGESVYCIRCNAAVKVQTVGNGWHIKCFDCSYGRHFGNAPLSARVKAAAHSVRQHHKVKVYSDTGIVEIVGEQQGQQSLT